MRTGGTKNLDLTVRLVHVRQFLLEVCHGGLFLCLVDWLTLPLSVHRNRLLRRSLARKHRLNAVLAFLDRFNERR